MHEAGGRTEGNGVFWARRDQGSRYLSYVHNLLSHMVPLVREPSQLSFQMLGSTPLGDVLVKPTGRAATVC